jgi:hypothetical protein
MGTEGITMSLTVCIVGILLLFFFFFGSTALVSLGRFFGSLIYTQSVGLRVRVISASQGRYLHTGQNKQNKRTETSKP